MKFGVRQVANVVLKTKAVQKVGNKVFNKGEPVLYIDTAKASTLEQSSSIVYATGGRGNSKLLAWQGDKSVTFTFENALLSPMSLAILSGAGLIKGMNQDEDVHFHQVSQSYIDEYGIIDLTTEIKQEEVICSTAPLYISDFTSLTGDSIDGYAVAADGKTLEPISEEQQIQQKIVTVDYYVKKKAADIVELQIGPDNFAGHYYVEANTVLRRYADGIDVDAVITIPNAKIQSNFSLTMASSGDPSTFTFTLDVFPGYTLFNQKKKVLCTIQIAEDNDRIDPGKKLGYVTMAFLVKYLEEEGVPILQEENSYIRFDRNKCALLLEEVMISGKT